MVGCSWSVDIWRAWLAQALTDGSKEWHMPGLWGNEYTRQELLRHVGQLSQVAGVRLLTFDDGPARGVRLLEFTTGTGFAFDVLVDRAFDIGRCGMGGIPLSWISGVGVVGPWYYEPEEWGWFRAWGGGLMVTCGLDHTMSPAEDSAATFNQPHMFERINYGLHGRVGGLPARLVGYGERWDGDDCVLWAEGEVVQTSVFLERLVLRRRIEARVGESRLVVSDTVENAGHAVTAHMQLYHCNIGFPTVDEGSELLIPSDATRTDPWETTAGYRKLSGPRPSFQEACFYERVAAGPDGIAPAAVVNRKLGLGAYQLFRVDELPEFMIWRMMGEGDYAVALEPGTNRAVPRSELRDAGELIELLPGQSRAYRLELGALVGSDAIDVFANRVAAATIRGGGSRETGR
jgi:hypothetical protein